MLLLGGHTCRKTAQAHYGKHRWNVEIGLQMAEMPSVFGTTSP